ncbi:hypothetical protein PMEGAPL125_48870 [Priestia megaterium]
MINNCTSKGVPRIIDTYTRAIMFNILLEDKRASAVKTANTMPMAKLINVSGIEY